MGLEPCIREVAFNYDTPHQNKQVTQFTPVFGIILVLLEGDDGYHCVVDPDNINSASIGNVLP